jgi:hypothetical protein
MQVSTVQIAAVVPTGPSAAPNMQLVLAALSVLLSQARAYLSGPFSAAMANTVQQLAAAGQQQALQPASAVSASCN